MNLLPILFSILVYLIHDFPEKKAIAGPIAVITVPLMACDRRSDSLELVKFYNATGGPNWWKKWDLTKPIDTWHGIELESGCVVTIDLEDTVENNICCNGSGNNLVGPLISVNLPFLKFLDLGKNKLTGVIPNLNMFPNLEYLDLHGNKLSGTIPNFDRLPKLTIMDLGANELISPIPNFDKLSLLNKLVLDENQFAGTIPNFDNLPNLNTLTISINSLTGSIPNFDKLHSLKTLGLVANQLTGTIPNFNNLPLLESLQLRINKLTGPIPNFDKLPNLVNITLDNNLLDGEIPEFDKLQSLERLGLGSNLLIGSLPAFSSCPKIIEINAAENNLNGFLPDYTISLPALSSISLRNNKFSFSGLINNASKVLIHTKKTVIGGSPDSLLYHPQQKIYSDTTITISPNTNYTLDLLIDDTVTTSTYTWFKDGLPYRTPIKGSNRLNFTPFTASDAGTYTVKITNPLAPQLTLESHPIRLVAGPQLVCDRVSDSLELIKFRNATGWEKWTIQWDLVKPIDTWVGITLTPRGCVEGIDMANLPDSVCCPGNKLTGNIPSLNLPSLKYYVLFANDLEGSIPDFDKLPNLELFDFGANTKLRGTIPNFKNLPKLKHLRARSTYSITGPLPNFDNLPNLESIVLGYNAINGPFPSFDKTPKLTYIELHINRIETLPNFTNLPNLEFLDLSGNVVYDSFAYVPNLTKLESLSLGGNKIFGPAPMFLASPKLKSLDLGLNNFSGLIGNYSQFNPLLSEFSLHENKFTFQDIIPHIKAIKSTVDRNFGCCYTDTLTYAPQQKIYTDTIITISSNTNYILDLRIDDTVTTSTYTWYKNDVQYKTIKGSNKLPFSPFTAADAGTYTVNITNPLAPQLTLESHPIQLVASPSLVCDRRADSLELVKFYNATGGANWWKKWDLTKPINTWWGIELNTNGCVKTIRVSDTTGNGFSQCCSGNNLTGSFPNLNLPELEVLHCQNNRGITGQIPNFDLPNLVELTIFTCMVNGPIPNFDKLPKLRILNLHDNKLTGSIRDFRQLPNLEDLNLSVNSLTGSISDFPAFQNLKKLELYTNQLTGSIPDFSQMPNLVLLYLQNNKLTGSIPNFRNLGSLTCMGLDNNMLSGALPNFEFLKKLQVAGISNNMLSGFLPDYSTSNPILAALTIDGNAYTFDGLVPNTLRVQDLTQRITSPDCPGSPERFVYHPQKKVYSDTTINIPPCTDYTLDLKFDDSVTSSTYTWFKDGSPFRTINGSNKLTFNSFISANNGTYTVSITNPLAPQLTLESHPIRLVSSGVMTNINNPQDTSLSCGLSFRLPPVTGQNLGSNAAYFTGPGRTGTQYASGQSITDNTTLYVHTSSGACFDEDTFSIRFTNPVIVLRPDTIRTHSGKPEPFNVLVNDIIPPGLTLNVTIEDSKIGSNIIYSQSSGSGTYTPRLDFVGTEILNYMVCVIDCPESCQSSTLTFIVEAPCGDRNSIVLPNVIFPTGSGANRYFIVEAISKCPDAWGPKPHKLEVFNRWGGLVFKNENYLNDWDGTNTAGQPLPEGTYYYLLDLGSVAAPVRGYVVIMR